MRTTLLVTVTAALALLVVARAQIESANPPAALPGAGSAPGAGAQPPAGIAKPPLELRSGATDVTDLKVAIPAPAKVVPIAQDYTVVERVAAVPPALKAAPRAEPQDTVGEAAPQGAARMLRESELKVMRRHYESVLQRVLEAEEKAQVATVDAKGQPDENAAALQERASVLRLYAEQLKIRIAAKDAEPVATGGMAGITRKPMAVASASPAGNARHTALRKELAERLIEKDLAGAEKVIAELRAGAKDQDATRLTADAEKVIAEYKKMSAGDRDTARLPEMEAVLREHPVLGVPGGPSAQSTPPQYAISGDVREASAPRMELLTAQTRVQRASLATEQVSLEEALEDLKRAQAAFAQKAISAEEMSRKEFAVKKSKARIDQMEAEIAATRAELELVKARMSKDQEEKINRDVLAIEKDRNDTRTLILKLEGQLKQVEKMKPEELADVLHILGIEDPRISKMTEGLVNASAKEAGLANSLAPESRSQLQALRGEKDYYLKELSKALKTVQQSLATQLQIQRDNLAELEDRLAKVKKLSAEENSKATPPATPPGVVPGILAPPPASSAPLLKAVPRAQPPVEVPGLPLSPATPPVSPAPPASAPPKPQPAPLPEPTPPSER